MGFILFKNLVFIYLDSDFAKSKTLRWPCCRSVIITPRYPAVRVALLVVERLVEVVAGPFGFLVVT